VKVENMNGAELPTLHKPFWKSLNHCTLYQETPFSWCRNLYLEKKKWRKDIQCS